LKIKSIIFFCLCLSGAVLSLPAQTVLDADQAVKIALESNLSLQRTRLEITGAKRRAGRSWNTLIPSLTASGSVNRATSLTDPVPPGQDKWVPGLSLSAALQLSPVMVTAIRETKKEYEAGLITYEGARQELEFQVRKLYYQILLLQSNASLMAQYAATAQNRYEQTLALGRVGRASRLDELSAQVDLQTQNANLRSAETQYSNALDALKQLLMIPAAENITLQGAFTVVSGDDGFGYSEGNSWSILSLRKSIELLETRRKSALNQAYAPTLSLSWNTSPFYVNKDWTDNGQFSIALSFSLDSLLPWSSAREQINSINDSITNQQSILQEAVLNSRNNIEQLRKNIVQTLENVETSRLNVTLAEETYRMYEEAYRTGAADFQSLRSAQDSLSLAQNRVLEEQYNLAAAFLELEKELNVPFGSLGKRE
jgi:outer membrane protein TolC